VLSKSVNLVNVTNVTSISTLSSIHIRPVAESRLRNVLNQDAFGNRYDYPATLLSVAFECIVDSTIQQPFVVNLTYTASIDRVSTSVSLSDLYLFYQDVCLATLDYHASIGQYLWRCMWFTPAERSAHPTNSSTSPPQILRGDLSTCGGTNGKIYAFAYVPVYKPLSQDDGYDFVRNNIQWIILGLILGSAFFIAVGYVGTRLYRYRAKYHEERKVVKDLRDEVAEMEMFGGSAGRKDDEVAMVENPLVVQLRDMQARYDANELKMRQAEAEARAQRNEDRQTALEKLAQDKDRLAKELEALRARLGAEEKNRLEKESARQKQEQQLNTNMLSGHIASHKVEKQQFEAVSPRKKGKDL